MSATGRGAKRRAHDEYLTPLAVATACIAATPWSSDDAPAWGLGSRIGARYLEPSAGMGVFMLAHRAQVRATQPGPGFDWTACEIQKSKKKRAACIAAGASRYVRGDFTRWMPLERFDFIGGNPPYNLAADFLRMAMFLSAPNGVVSFLLRVNFLIAAERWGLLREYPPVSVLALQPRVSFFGTRQTDATDYAWITWRRRDRLRTDLVTRFGSLWWREDDAVEQERRLECLDEVRRLDWTRD